MFTFEKTAIEGVYIIEPQVFGDARGYFMETYNEKAFSEAGLHYNFVQDNQSRSKKGVLRGLHFQKNYPQAKLVRVIEGEVFDVAVDLRENSPTYGKWVGVILSSENQKQFMVPRGFAHGFVVLSESATFCYKCDEFYHPEDEGGIMWNDPEIGIEWPYRETPLLSEKDRKYPSFCESKIRFRESVLSKEDKIVVTGVRGQLGYDVCRELGERGFKNVIGIDIEELDITDEDKVKAFIGKERPSVVIHSSAWTAVDKAEEYPDRVFEVNALGAKYLAEACERCKAKMIFISTDYVFPGVGETPYREEDPVGALGVYGKTKASGEIFVREACTRHFIVRTSWVFGINGNNFVKTMLRLSETKKELEVVADQIGSPTYTYDLSKLLCDMAESEYYGTYHATNEGYCSWYEFAKKIFELAKIETISIRPTTTKAYQAKIKQAYRPLNSRLSKEKLEKYGFHRLPGWEDALCRYIGNELKR